MNVDLDPANSAVFSSCSECYTKRPSVVLDFRDVSDFIPLCPECLLVLSRAINAAVEVTRAKGH